MKRVSFFNSLRVKLGIITIFMIGIPIIVFSLIYSQNVKNVIVKKYTESAEASVNETSEKINLILEDINKFSSLIISNQELLTMAKNHQNFSQNDFNNKLRSFITIRSDIEAIKLRIEENSYSIGVNIINEDPFIPPELKNSKGQPIWMPTKDVEIEILAGNFKKYYYTLSRKLIDYNTLNHYGYLMIDLDEIILEQSYSEIQGEENEEVFICDRNGRIISHPDKSKIGTYITLKPYGEEILSNDNGNLEYFAGEKRLAIFSTIDNNGWKVIKTIATTNLYREINDIQRFLSILGFIYGVLIITFMIIFSIRYTEPMFKMMGVIKKVEEGDLSARMPIKSNDEIGHLGYSLNNMIDEMQNLIDKLIEEEQEKKEVELEALHAQINPHFLHNTLNTIKWMAKIQGNISVSKAITSLVKLLRVSTNLSKEKITLAEEIDYLKNYMVIQRLRFNEEISLEFRIEEDCLQLKVPKLILQPIVENSIIHGLEKKSFELKIRIKVYKKEEQVFIEIIDNGPGIKKETLDNIFESESAYDKFSKVGLNNVNKRIKLYFGSEYGLNIRSKPGYGTKIIVNLPDMINY
ncbi:two-component system sensor histidine kinase YesM [Halanaerobium saccharolyticum]|uniref:histidine kinase n=1 Tax=Halanaerobium saccharolyticum TaxID=43595 RepID=A0A4R6L7W7_9FIRM|nr:sensor histidine kinase [Halanaerobium saccharolyticum]TDO70037.1 two-component system sensor histidine kinase YesM [Halanaerobium saccharolyticum]